MQVMEGATHYCLLFWVMTLKCIFIVSESDFCIGMAVCISFLHIYFMVPDQWLAEVRIDGF